MCRGIAILSVNLHENSVIKEWPEDEFVDVHCVNGDKVIVL